MRQAYRLDGGLMAAALAVALSGCGSRGEVAFAPEAAAVGTVETVLVSTARRQGETLPLYTSDRAFEPGFARFLVSVPPDREPGTVTYPRHVPPDPATEFIVVSGQRLPDARAFVGAINGTIATNADGRRDSALFVHGFNTNFAEGLYRQAQLQHDLERHGVSVHFAWPSAARSQSYALDRESALFSRPALETTLTALAQSDTDEITLIAHSMGAFLLMDTLSAMARGGNDALFRKLHAVVLISPDLEVDLFRQQAPVILARGAQIVVLVSRGDRALEISSFIHRESDRLGDIRSVDELGGLDVTVIDISAVRSEDLLGHFKEATSPALIDYVRGLHGTGLEALVQDRQVGLGERGATLIQKGAAIFSAPLAGQ